MEIHEIEGLLKEILPENCKGNKPHKSLAFLAILEGIESGRILINRIFHDNFYRHTFSNFFKKFGREGDSDRPHTPFFYLKTSKFWRLIPHEGKEYLLSSVHPYL